MLKMINNILIIINTISFVFNTLIISLLFIAKLFKIRLINHLTIRVSGLITFFILFINLALFCILINDSIITNINKDNNDNNSRQTIMDLSIFSNMCYLFIYLCILSIYAVYLFLIIYIQINIINKNKIKLNSIVILLIILVILIFIPTLVEFFIDKLDKIVTLMNLICFDHFIVNFIISNLISIIIFIVYPTYILFRLNKVIKKIKNELNFINDIDNINLLDNPNKKLISQERYYLKLFNLIILIMFLYYPFLIFNLYNYDIINDDLIILYFKYFLSSFGIVNFLMFFMDPSLPQLFKQLLRK